MKGKNLVGISFLVLFPLFSFIASSAFAEEITGKLIDNFSKRCSIRVYGNADVGYFSLKPPAIAPNGRETSFGVWGDIKLDVPCELYGLEVTAHGDIRIQSTNRFVGDNPRAPGTGERFYFGKNEDPIKIQELYFNVREPKTSWWNVRLGQQTTNFGFFYEYEHDKNLLWDQFKLLKPVALIGIDQYDTGIVGSFTFHGFKLDVGVTNGEEGLDNNTSPLFSSRLSKVFVFTEGPFGETKLLIGVSGKTGTGKKSEEFKTWDDAFGIDLRASICGECVTFSYGAIWDEHGAKQRIKRLYDATPAEFLGPIDLYHFEKPGEPINGFGQFLEIIMKPRPLSERLTLRFGYSTYDPNTDSNARPEYKTKTRVIGALSYLISENIIFNIGIMHTDDPYMKEVLAKNYSDPLNGIGIFTSFEIRF